MSLNFLSTFLLQVQFSGIGFKQKPALKKISLLSESTDKPERQQKFTIGFIGLFYKSLKQH